MIGTWEGGRLGGAYCFNMIQPHTVLGGAISRSFIIRISFCLSGISLSHDCLLFVFQQWTSLSEILECIPGGHNQEIQLALVPQD